MSLRPLLVAIGVAGTMVSVNGRVQSPAATDVVAQGWPAVVKAYRAALAEAGIVGSALVMVRDGRVVAADYAGLADRESKRAVDADTIFHWASITKTFTGIAIMQLRDRGLLSLDDPVVRYVPELSRVHNRFGDVSQITLRHLMSHSAGFRAATWPWGGDQPWHPYEPTRWEQVVAMLPYTDVQFAPGSRYSYSNPGVIFLGRTIELLSGDDYEVYVTKNILMPLEMRRSFFDRAPYHLLAHRSHSYFKGEDGLREARFDFDTGITVSNGGLNAPMADMARYFAFLIGGGSEVYEGVLKRSSLEEMWAPVLPAADGEGGSGADVRAALSFFVERHGGLELVGHSGNQNGFLSHLYIHRPSRSGYLVAFNTDATSKVPVAREITREVDDTVRDALIEHVFSRF